MTSPVPGIPDVSGATFEVSRELLVDAHIRVSNLQDEIGKYVRHANVLSRSVPLGGGYAGEVGAFMAEYGLGRTDSAVDTLVAFGREMEKLKQNIATSLEKYTSKDQSAGSEFDCLGG